MHKNNLAVLYGRVSMGFVKQGRSVEAQDPRMRDYCQQKLIEIGIEDGSLFPSRRNQPYIFYDGVSGKIPVQDRPQGCAVWRLLELRRVGHLIITKCDRLGRRAGDMINFADSVEALGIAVHLVDEGGEIDRRDPGARAMFQIRCVMSEMQQRTTVRNITHVLDAKVERGEFCGGYGPYGWDAIASGQFKHRPNAGTIEIKTLVEHPTQMYWLRQMMNWRGCALLQLGFERRKALALGRDFNVAESQRLKHTGLGYYRIAKMLNEQGAPTKLPARTPVKGADGAVKFLTSGQWTGGSVEHALTSSYTEKLFLAGQGAVQAP